MTFMSETGSSGYPASAPAPSGPLRMTPGRWLVLGLALPVAIALIGWAGFDLVSLVARGTYSFSSPVPVQSGQVNVNVNGADVTLRQTSGNTARLTGSVQYGLFRPDFTESTTAGGTAVGVNCIALNSSCNVNATLDVPARTAVTLNSGGGNIGVSGFSSNLTLSAAGGNLTASNLTGNLLLDTGGGDLTGSGLAGNTIHISTEGGNIDASSLDGPMRLDTGGGDLNGNGFTGSLQVFTAGGNIDASAVASQQVNVQSGGGDVTLAFTQPPQNLQITANGGNIDVILPHGDTKYAISTPGNSGGNINIQPGLAGPTSNTISVNSGGGDITITEAS